MEYNFKVNKHSSYAVGTKFDMVFNGEVLLFDGYCFPDSDKDWLDFFSNIKIEYMGDFYSEDSFAKEYGVETLRNLVKYLFDYYRSNIIPEYDFLKYHCTGDISDDAYEGYEINYPIEDYGRQLINFIDDCGEEISLRQSDKKNKYVKHDGEGEILRDKDGNALYLDDEEVLEKGYNLYETTIVAFDSKENSIGLASDEFGSDGIWVNKSHQGRGVGLMLLKNFREQFPEDRKIGQMTDAGMKLASKYFHKHIKDK